MTDGEVVELVVEVGDPAGEGAHREQRRVAHRVARTGSQRRRLGGQLGHREPLEAASHLVIGGEDRVAQLTERGDPFRRRRTTRDHQHPDRFDVTARGLGLPERLTRQRRPGRDHGVDRVGLAFPAPHLPVRSIDLDHRDPGPLQLTGQPGPVRAGALHADQLHVAVGAQPVDQLLGSRPRSWRTTRRRAPRRPDRPRPRRAHLRACRHPRSPNMSSLRWSSPSLPVAFGFKGWHALAGRVPGTRDC